MAEVSIINGYEICDDTARAKTNGHVVTDGTTDYTQRAKLKFIGATITDDSTNNQTIVEMGDFAGKTDVAPEEVSPAEATHAKDSLLYYNGTLYKALTAIAIGDTLTVNTNIAATTVNDELSQKGGAFNVSITYPRGASQTVTLTNGVDTYTATLSAQGEAVITVKNPGTYTASVGGTSIGSVDVGVYEISHNAAKIYGFHLDGTKSDPAQMVSYQVKYDGVNVDNYDYTAAAVNLTTGVMNPGDWNLTDDFFIPRSCMLKHDGTVDYYLDENDETKKADGTASDVANTSYDGEAMMEWGRDGDRIYVKVVPDSTPTDGATFYVSNQKLDNGFTDYPFYDADGNEIDHFYTPKYNGSAVSNKLRSLSGQTPINSQTGATEVSYANALNTHNKVEWDTEVIADRMLINILLIMIGKSTATQEVFGEGYTTGGSGADSLATTGTLNGKGQWFGSSTNNDPTKGVKVFGMEHWWGNIWRRQRGYLNVSGTIKYKMTYSQVDGSTQNGYDDTGSGYKTVANGTPSGTSGGYISEMVFNADGMFAKVASGSETTYYTDGLHFNNGQTDRAIVGGGCAHGSRCGALCVYLRYAFSFAAWDFGAALSCKPLAA